MKPWFGKEDLQDAIAELHRLGVITRERERIIKSKLHEIWQDNDAPEAEEATKTSLRCRCRTLGNHEVDAAGCPLHSLQAILAGSSPERGTEKEGEQ